MLFAAPARLNLVVIGLIVTLILYISFRARAPEEQDVDFPSYPNPRSRVVAHSSDASESLYQVQNETLGFQEIYMISLPGRTDKQDAFAMQAAFSDMLWTQMDGIYGNEVPAKALPHVRAPLDDKYVAGR